MRTFCNAPIPPPLYRGPMTTNDRQLQAKEDAAAERAGAPAERQPRQPGILVADLSDLFTQRRRGRGGLVLPPHLTRSRP